MEPDPWTATIRTISISLRRRAAAHKSRLEFLSSQLGVVASHRVQTDELGEGLCDGEARTKHAIRPSLFAQHVYKHASSSRRADDAKLRADEIQLEGAPKAAGEAALVDELHDSTARLLGDVNRQLAGEINGGSHAVLGRRDEPRHC